MWISLRFAVASFSVTTDQCVAPTLDYNALTVAGSEGVVYIYTMHVTIHLLLQWESCGVLVLLPEHQQHYW